MSSELIYVSSLVDIFSSDIGLICGVPCKLVLARPKYAIPIIGPRGLLCVFRFPSKSKSLAIGMDVATSSYSRASEVAVLSKE